MTHNMYLRINTYKVCLFSYVLLAHSFCHLIEAYASRQIEEPMKLKKVERMGGGGIHKSEKFFFCFSQRIGKKLLLFYFSGRTSWLSSQQNHFLEA